jgi:DNA polymerase-1
MSLYDKLWYAAYQVYPDGVAPPPAWKEITTENVDEVCAYFALGRGDVAIDTETFGDKYHRDIGRRYAGDALHQVYAQVSCIGFYDGVSLFVARAENRHCVAKVLETLRDVGWRIVYWNALFDRAVLRNTGFPEILDIDYRDAAVRKWMICHRLEDKSYGEMSLAWFVENLLRGKKGSFRDEVGMDATLGVSSLSDDDWAALLQRVAGDTYYTLLADRLLDEVLPTDLVREYTEIERPTSDVIFDMETAGVRVDEDTCLEIEHALREEAKELERAFNRRALQHIQDPVNLSSYPQLSRYFYDVLGFVAPPREKVPEIKAETERSTGEAIVKFWMKQHKNEECALLLDYRKVNKLRSSYIIAPMQDMDDDGRIYPKTNQTGTATGRFNMERPSLHNLPAREDKRWLEQLRELLGIQLRELPEDVQDILLAPSARYGLRRIYIPDEDCVFIGADYSQVELRLLAHFSEDPTLLDVFRSGKDPHSATGAKLMNVDYDKFTELYEAGDDEAAACRRAGKTINFAVLYGAGAHRLASQLHISVDDAEQFLDNYFASHPGVTELKETIEYYMERRGEVRTLLRRVRPIAVFQRGFSFELGQDLSRFKEEVQSWRAMQKGKREGFNCVIQGSAADIIKAAMVRLYRDKLFMQHARIVLTIHDEIVASCKKKHAEHVAERMVEIMKDPFGDPSILKVPLDVDCHVGENLSAIK